MPADALVYGTSAIRNAENASAFVDTVRAKTGFPIQVIDGETEAGLIFPVLPHRVFCRTESLLLLSTWWW